MRTLDLLDMEEHFDLKPTCGWLQKYVFFYAVYEGKKRRFHFNFANEHFNGKFKKSGYDIGEYCGPGAWLLLDRYQLVEEMIVNPSVKGRREQEHVKAQGIWGKAVGAPWIQYDEGKPVGVKMYWKDIIPMTPDECKEMIKLQWDLVKAGKLMDRPRLSDYMEKRNEEMGRFE